MGKKLKNKDNYVVFINFLHSKPHHLYEVQNINIKINPSLRFPSNNFLFCFRTCPQN